MAPNDQTEFTQVRRRKTSGNRKSAQHVRNYNVHNNNNKGSLQRFRAPNHKKCPVPSAAPEGPVALQNTCCRMSRRSSTASTVSEVSAGSTDPDVEDELDGDKLRIDLSGEALNTGLTLEILILEALINQPEMSLFKNHGFNHLRFVHPEGDLFTWLEVTRTWVAQLQNGTVENWYQSNHINEATLRHIERHVESRRRTLSHLTGQSIALSFGKDSQISNELIANVLLSRFSENISIYHGHPSLGYKVLSTGNTVFIHPTSSIVFLNQYPTYIIYADVPNKTTREVRAVFVLNDGLARSLLDFNSIGNDIDGVIKENVVKPCKFDNIGESVSQELQTMWDRDRTGEESLKEILMFQCNYTPLLFERDTKSTSVVIFALAQYHQTVKDIVENEIEKIRNRFKDECLEIGFPDGKSHLRLLLGPGAANEKFLFSHDFRSVWIHETQAGTLSQNFVQTEMEKYGKVVDIQVSDETTREDSGIWGTVTFHDPDDVVKLLAASKSHDAGMLIELAPNICNNFTQAVSKVSVDRTVKVKVMLCRRPAKSGLAFVTIKGKRDLGILLNTKNLTIGKDKVKISTRPGSADDIQISGLSPIAKEREIHDAIVSKFGITPSAVDVDRQPSFSSSADDLHRFKTSLQRLVDKAADVSKVHIRVFMPSPDDIYLMAELKFQTRRVAISAMDYICGANIRGLPLQIVSNPLNNPDVPVVTIRVNNDVYQMTKAGIKKHLSQKADDIDVRISTKDDYHELKIFSQNVVASESLASRIEEILSPLQFTISRKRLEYLISDGESILNTTMAETKTYINLARETRTVDIYGTKSHIQKAKRALVENFVQFIRQPEQRNEAMYRVPLSGPGRPPTLMIDIAKDLDALTSRTGVKNLRVDINGRALCYSGTDEEHFAMQAIIESICDLAMNNTLMAKPANLTEPEQDSEEDSDECSGCYCPIEGWRYSLQTCGHSYCEECMDTHIRVSLENKTFPIACVDEHCGQPLCVRDIIILSRRLDRGIWKVLKTSTDHYVQTRPKEFGFCHKPDCHGVIQKKPNAIAYCCSLCNSKMCPRCLNTYHGHESCENYLNNTAFKEWMASSRDRKKCPNCGMAIEKIDGCNRVQCTNCQRHICWVCLQHYPDMRLAYDHLNREHNGYM